MLFLRSLWKSKYYFLAATAILLLVSQPWNEHWIMTAPGGNSFFSSTELIVPFIMQEVGQNETIPENVQGVFTAIFAFTDVVDWEELRGREMEQMAGIM